MIQYAYNLHHFRGPLVGTYNTPMAAQEAKESQKNPSEHYWEMIPKDSQETPICTQGVLAHWGSNNERKEK